MFNSWLQWSGSDGITGGPCSYNDYVSALTDPDWVALKAALQRNAGGWSNQSFEMFHHFLKLNSLGATPAQIQSVYTTLTVQSGSEPVLDPSGFNDITPTTWQDYRSYIWNVGVGWSQLGIQGLNETRDVGIVSAGTVITVTRHADTSFVASAGFYQDPPSGCCFERGTNVVLGDGCKIPINNIEPGQMVSSSTSSDGQKSIVRWVSRPMQKSRPLYEIKNFPGVLFTSTHPIYLGKAADGVPILGFVDLDSAERVNFLWTGFHIERLPKEDLIEHLAGIVDQELFDLVLEHQDNSIPNGFSKNGVSAVTIPSFIVTNASGQKLSVCSEAPDMKAHPATTRFILAFAKSLGGREDIKRFFPDGLRMGVLDYEARIRRYRSSCALQALKPQLTGDLQLTQSQNINLDAILSIFEEAKIAPQILADSTEAMIATLGMTLPAILANGWQYNRSVVTEDSDGDEINVISTHFLQLTQPAVRPSPASLALSQQAILSKLHLYLRQYKSLIAVSCTMSSKLNATNENKIPFVTPSHQALGPNLHILQANLKCPSGELTGTPTYTLVMNFGTDLSLIASGSLTNDTIGQWPVYYSPHNNVISSGIDPLMCSFNIGWLTVSSGRATQSQLDNAASWYTAERGMPKMEKYAELLGTAVGQDVVRTVYGEPQ